MPEQSNPMSDHDATREILAAVDDYAEAFRDVLDREHVGTLVEQDGAARYVPVSRAHLEATIRRAFERGAVIEAAVRAFNPARFIEDMRDSQDEVTEDTWDCLMAYMHDAEQMRAALAAGAGATTEGEDGER